MKLYNTLTRKIETLKPLENKTVKIYTCGLTVYSQPHIGNWVGYIYWDVLQRALEADGYLVLRVQNYTDVGHLVSDDDSGEDKMEKGARLEGKTAWQIAEKYIAIAEHEGYDLLGLRRPTLIRATECIEAQIDFVKILEDKGFTYNIPEEGVYFDTAKLKDYGKLARLDIEGLKEGARVEVTGKKNPTDFAVWKFSPQDKKRDMEWNSPWGKGFPGWHLECSVIARENLGDQIDIHCGGVDHIPVHHTNEIAQTEAVTKKQFSQIWLHNNHLKVNNSKMSKSEGNIYTLQDILDKDYDLDAFKLMILSKHYSTEGNFTWEILQSFEQKLKKWRAAADCIWSPVDVDTFTAIGYESSALLDYLNDNLNTTMAISMLDVSFFEDVLEQGYITKKQLESFRKDLHEIEKLLGLTLIGDDITNVQKELIQKRHAARKDKNWQLSDTLRDDLAKQNIGIRDTKMGQIWYRL